MKKSHSFGLVFAAGLLLITLAAAVCAGYPLFFADSEGEESNYRTYDYHIALISSEKDTKFWSEVYDSIVTTGEAHNVYVEETGEGLFGQLSMEDAMNIAIYQNVDGILLWPGEEKSMRTLIDKACGYGIPVITMQKDVPHSDRQGFVGVNDYWMGQEYGKRVKKIATNRTRLVTVLFPGASFNASNRDWFQRGLNDVLQDTNIRLDIRVALDDHGLNNAEEVLQDMVMGGKRYPDIIICLDEVLTQTTVQMLQQLPNSGEIKVIGSFASPKILEGIEQGTIDSTITIDPVVLGRESMEAMMTYLQYNMVSYHTEVGTQLIDGASLLP